MQPLERQTHYWDRVADEKEFTHPIDFPRIRPLVPQTARILDYGCGYGRSCHELWEAGFRNTTGVDISEEMIRRGRDLHPHLHLEVLRSPRLPHGDGTFDAVLLFAVLTCIPTDQGQSDVVADIFRALKPAGLLYVSDYLLQSDERNRERYEEFVQKHGVFGMFEVDGGALVRHHSRRHVRSLLSGFDELSWCELQVLTMNRNPARIFQWIGRKPEGSQS
jgi:SAM-dependent methyltransferase